MKSNLPAAVGATTPLTISQTFNITNETLGYIMCAALEGGINYWTSKASAENKADLEKVEYLSDIFSVGGVILIKDAEGHSNPDRKDGQWVLTKEKLMSGIAQYVKHEGVAASTDEEFNDEIGGVDAGGADSIVQFALFNELVFG